MTESTQNLEALMIMLCKTTAQNPMSDGQIASLKDITCDQANAMLDKLYECKAISSVKSIKDGKEQRLVWVTGLPYKPATQLTKDLAWQHLRSQGNTRLQLPIETTQDTTMDDKKNIELIVPSNLLEAGIKTPQKIVRLLFANSKATSNEIRKNCQIVFVDPFIKAYVRKGYIERTKNQDNLAVYAITPKGRLLGSADELYNHAKVKHPSKMAKKSSNDNEGYISLEGANITVVTQEKKPDEADCFIVDDAQSPNSALSDDRKHMDMVFDNLIAEENAHSTLETKDSIRFALTSDGTLMIMGIQFAPIELTKPQTDRLIEFMENTAGVNL